MLRKAFCKKHQERFPGRKAGNPDGWNEWKLTSPGTIGNIESNNQYSLSNELQCIKKDIRNSFFYAIYCLFDFFFVLLQTKYHIKS